MMMVQIQTLFSVAAFCTLTALPLAAAKAAVGEGGHCDGTEAACAGLGDEVAFLQRDILIRPRPGGHGKVGIAGQATRGAIALSAQSQTSRKSKSKSKVMIGRIGINLMPVELSDFEKAKLEAADAEAKRRGDVLMERAASRKTHARAWARPRRPQPMSLVAHEGSQMHMKDAHEGIFDALKAQSGIFDTLKAQVTKATSDGGFVDKIGNALFGRKFEAKDEDEVDSHEDSETEKMIEVEEKCRGLVADAQLDSTNPNPMCEGPVTENPRNRNAGLEQPLQCLKDKFQDVYVKMCVECGKDGRLDGIVSANTKRGKLPCAPRYNALNRIADRINANDANIVQQLRRSANLIPTLMGAFPNEQNGMDEALQSKGVVDYMKLFSLGSVVDTNDDREITLDETKAFLQATYVVAKIAGEAVVSADVPVSGIDSWADKDMGRWVQFFKPRVTHTHGVEDEMPVQLSRAAPPPHSQPTRTEAAHSHSTRTEAPHVDMVLPGRRSGSDTSRSHPEVAAAASANFDGSSSQAPQDSRKADELPSSQEQKKARAKLTAAAAAGVETTPH